ncbi:dhs-2 [Pristionchus pacificus]|uniref:Dehydrogenase n=1 Tax=Pristionchus pacificus TaxID=54126 RepID=A0A2A6BLF8_PRIPA|nr:dhs-2 [Pristionchus pacificus]|eukprot:PDM66739.1 dehydrogenase [Pristionchus pacificus]
MSSNRGFLWLAIFPGVPYTIYHLKDVTFLWGLTAVVLLWLLYVIIQKILGLLVIDDLEKRAVFITGCDTGFGNLLTIKCLERGMPVFAGCLTEKGAESLRKAAEYLPGKLETIIVDVSSDESVAKAAAYLDKATEQYGGLHGVVNNAGIVGSSFFDDMLTTKDYKTVAEVNTFGVIRVTQASKHLVKKTRGRIVTVASICARVGIMGLGPYTVSKFAVSGYCEVIRQELRYFDVSVHILEPGFFRTPLIDEKIVQARLDEMWKTVPEPIKEEYGEKFFKESRERATDMLHKIGSPHVHLVVDAYFHALTARFPHLRYQIGNDSKFLFIPLSYLPTGARDALFALGEKISGAPVPENALQKYAVPKTTAILIDDIKSNSSSGSA